MKKLFNRWGSNRPLLNYDLKMKLTTLVLITTFIGLHANDSYAQKTKITLEVENATVNDIIDDIESATDFRFIYMTKHVDLQRTLSLKVTKEHIKTVLKRLFDDTNTVYKVRGTQIILKEVQKENTAKEIPEQTPIEQLQDQTQVTGQVTDRDGVPLPGANIVEKGTSNGVTTDFDGNFTIKVTSENAILVVSYIGYTTMEVAVNNQNQIQIVLIEDTSKLDEVIIVSYGSQSTREITGAVENVKIEEMLDEPVAQVGQMLQGKIAGVRINQTTGRPGEGIKVQIRGASSFTAGSDPLYVVDGLPIVGGISSMNPSEISNISVLKDAAATSLYGSRASNGVVLIQTVSGIPGRTKISFNHYTAFQQIPENRKIKMMNARQYAEFQQDVAVRNGRPVDPAFANPEEYGEGTDWFEEITRTGLVQNYNVNFATATDKVSTAAVLGYFKNKGVINETGFERLSLRINTLFTPNDKLKLGLNIAPTYTHNTNFNTDGNPYTSDANIVSSALITSPLASPYNADGSLALNAEDPATFGNPNWVRAANDITIDNNNLILLSNAFLEYEILDGLRFRTSANIQHESSRLFSFRPSTVGRLFRSAPQIPSGSENKSNFYNWALENTLSFEKEIGDHKIELLGGFTTQKYKSNGTLITATNYADDNIKEVGAAAQTQITSLVQEWSLASYLGRINYKFKDKYLLSASFRGDGSSRFGPKNRWGYFPSASVGWVATEENFWNLESVSFFKIRASYGLTGNFNIGNYAFRNALEPTFSIIGNSLVQGRAAVNLGDETLGWEKQKQLNIGADLYLFSDRLQLNYNYFNKNVSDLLYEVNVPLTSGFSSLQTNIGELKFWGHEFFVQSYNIQNDDFSWDTSFNISFNRNKVLALDTESGVLHHGQSLYSFFSHISEVGEPMSQFYGAIQDGVYVDQQDFDNSPKHASSQVGTVKFRDLNGDGEITFPEDFTTIGNPWPQYTYGMTNSFKFKNLDFAFTVIGSQGNEILERYQNWTTNLDGVFNVLEVVKDRWISPEQPGAGLYGSTQGGTTYLERDRWSSRFINDGSYLSFRNLTLGYTLPLKETSWVSRFRIYGSIQNAFIITKYKGPNPEVNTSTANNDNTPGFDANSYPVPRTVSVGINWEF